MVTQVKNHITAFYKKTGQLTEQKDKDDNLDILNLFLDNTRSQQDWVVNVNVASEEVLLNVAK